MARFAALAMPSRAAAAWPAPCRLPASEPCLRESPASPRVTTWITVWHCSAICAPLPETWSVCWRQNYRPELGTYLGGLLLKRSEEHTSELQSLRHLVCRLLLEKKKNICL